MSAPSETLKELLSLLEEAGSYVLASPEDANYFRTRKKSQPLKQKDVVIKKTEPPPPFTASLREVVQETEPVASFVEPIKPAPVIKKVETPPSPSFKETLPPLKPMIKEEISSFNFSAMRNLLSIVAPELAILHEIPKDDLAKKISERWKTKNKSAPISVLLFQEPAEQKALLEQIAKALDVYFGPAKIVHAEKIEKDKQWEAFLSVADLKLVIVCDYTLWQLSSLMQFYKETPAQGTRMLRDTPLFLLPDLSLYLKDPLLKRSLWKALCQKIT